MTTELDNLIDDHREQLQKIALQIEDLKNKRTETVKELTKQFLRDILDKCLSRELRSALEIIFDDEYFSLVSVEHACIIVSAFGRRIQIYFRYIELPGTKIPGWFIRYRDLSYIFVERKVFFDHLEPALLAALHAARVLQEQSLDADDADDADDDDADDDDDDDDAADADDDE
jgi:hypothetical protein